MLGCEITSKKIFSVENIFSGICFYIVAKALRMVACTVLGVAIASSSSSSIYVLRYIIPEGLICSSAM